MTKLLVFKYVGSMVHFFGTGLAGQIFVRSCGEEKLNSAGTVKGCDGS